MFTTRAISALLLTVCFGLTARGAAQTGGSRAAPQADLLAGSGVYALQCAPCHGYDGRGSGPIAGTFKMRPPDLTGLAARNRGVFPRARLESFLAQSAADATSGHGTSEMQLWGPTFRSLDSNDPRLTARIRTIVDHLQSMQNEVTIASGRLSHHVLTNDLFHVDELWMQVIPNTEFHRWLSRGIDREIAIILTPHPDRFADVKGVRILTGTLIHNTQPTAAPIVHELFLKDLTTGAFSPIVFQTTDVGLARTFDVFDNAEVSVVIQVK